MQYTIGHHGNVALNIKHSCVRLITECCLEFAEHSEVKSIHLQWTNFDIHVSVHRDII